MSAPGAKRCGELVGQPARESELGRAERGDVPLRLVGVLHRHERRLSAHRQAHVGLDQRRVDVLAERLDLLPLVLAVGARHARALVHAADLVGEGQRRARRARCAGDRGGGERLGGAGQRDVPLAGEQARGRVQSDPAGAGDVGLGPRVQVGEVLGGAGRAVEWLGVGIGCQLHQVARREARGEPEAAQRVDEQPGAVAAGAVAGRERLLGRLHARLHAHVVGDVAEDALVERDEEVDHLHRLARHLGQPLALQRAGVADLQVRGEVVGERGVVAGRARCWRTPPRRSRTG